MILSHIVDTPIYPSPTHQQTSLHYSLSQNDKHGNCSCSLYILSIYIHPHPTHTPYSYTQHKNVLIFQVCLGHWLFLFFNIEHEHRIGQAASMAIRNGFRGVTEGCKLRPLCCHSYEKQISHRHLKEGALQRKMRILLSSISKKKLGYF